MCMVWTTCGIVSGDVLVMDILSYTRGEQQKSWYFTYFWEYHHAWNTHKIVSRGVLVTDRPHYTWNYLSCVTESCTMDRHEVTNLTKILARSTQVPANLARSTQVPANLARLTNVGLHSPFLHWWYIHTKSHLPHN